MCYDKGRDSSKGGQVMNNEKVTMKDIANELDISLATVSYVLNHSEKEKISHATRMKVLETAKRLGYVPNQTAKSLSRNRSNLIGIIVNLSKYASSYMKHQALDLAAELHNQIYDAGFDTILSVVYEMEDIQIKYKHSLEAVFIIDINEKSLNKITKKYYIPLVFLDCDFAEGLFYKIMPDYNALVAEAKKRLEDEHPFLVMDQIINERLRDQIIQNFDKDDIFINKANVQSGSPNMSKSSSLKEFLTEKKSRKGIIIGDFLASQVERYIDNSDIIVISSSQATDILLPDTRRIIVSNRQKSKKAMEILMHLMHLDYDENSFTRVMLLPDPPAELNINSTPEPVA
jgi:DNA-binding LacI/PurR family transcriptional regulator